MELDIQDFYDYVEIIAESDDIIEEKGKEAGRLLSSYLYCQDYLLGDRDKNIQWLVNEQRSDYENMLDVCYNLKLWLGIEHSDHWEKYRDWANKMHNEISSLISHGLYQYALSTYQEKVSLRAN